MNILDSVVEGALALPNKRDADALICAVVRFMATGEDPDLSGVAGAMWVAIRPAVENSRSKSVAGRAGGKQNGRQTAKQTEKQNGKQSAKQNGKQNAKQNGKQNGKQSAKQNGKQTAKQNDKQSEIKRASEHSSSSSSYSYSYSGVEGCGEEGFCLEPPTAAEARTYFAANCLRGNPDEFLDHFAAQGWVRSNGQAIADWRAQARQWSRKQAEFDQAKPADLRAPEKPMPKAVNAVDWEAEAAMLDMEGADGGWRG